ncbi:MAG: GAF domain-containing protein [Nostocales cyanobacterium]|nr:MAG: GAF domain-containing protein [Nostocales cyanobacterium]TAF19671.1 MAG: GAF domain-containing protein [Nostocales cyanobacterium]
MVTFSSANQSYSSSTHCISIYQSLITDLGQKALVINNYEAFCKIAVVRIADTFQVDHVRIWQVGSDGQSLYQVVNYGFSPVAKIKNINIESYPPLKQILNHEHSVLTEEIYQGFYENHPTPLPDNSISGVSVPIISESQVILGLLEIYSQVERKFTTNEIHCLQSISYLLTNLFDRQIKSNLEQIQSTILAEVADGKEIKSIYNHLCLLLEKILPNAYCSILIRDPQENKLKAGAVPNVPVEYAQGIDGLMIGECSGSCGTAAYRGEAVFVNDIATDPVWVNFKDFALDHNIRACWSSPFLSKTGEVLGTFAISHTTPCYPTSYHLAILKMATHLASIATENSGYTMNLEKEIAEKNQALQALNKIQTQLIQSEKLSSLGQLSAGIVHEINNPMSCIVGNLPYVHDYIQTLLNVISIYEKNYPQYTSEIASELEDLDLDFIKSDLVNIINSMTDSTQRIQDISHSMLTFARADNQQKVFYNLHEGLDSTLLILKHRLKNQGNRPAIQVFKDYGNIPNFKCFPGQINQVFMNLLTNSLDAIESFSSRKLHQITVKTSVNSDRSAILITIQDTGIGMSEEVKRHLFEYSYTTKEVGKGTGLGLSISQQIIVEKHDGEITCSSTMGEGTSFMIRLPI